MPIPPPPARKEPAPEKVTEGTGEAGPKETNTIEIYANLDEEEPDDNSIAVGTDDLDV